jgi:hypothetical protein
MDFVFVERFPLRIRVSLPDQITLCYGYYVLHSEHCFTTLKRVVDENSKFKSAIIAIYKQVNEVTVGRAERLFFMLWFY